MKGEQHQTKKAAGAIGELFANEKPEQFQKVAEKPLKAFSPKDAMGLSDAMVEGIYGQAYRLYNTGKYKDAIQLFRLLIMLNPVEPKYAMGLAACFHMLKEYKSAADSYSIVGVIDPDSPVPFYHASDCYIQMGDPISALLALEMALKRAGDKPEFRTLRDRAHLTAENLKKEVDKFKK